MRETRACKKCGGEFSYERKRKSGRSRLFCSATCKAERLVELNERYRREGRYRVRARAAQRAKIAKICVVCRIAFQTVNPLTRCCGPVCGHRFLTPRAHATRSANAIIRRTRTCQRCGLAFVMRNPSGKARRGLANEGLFVRARAPTRSFVSTRPGKKRRQRLAPGLASAKKNQAWARVECPSPSQRAIRAAPSLVRYMTRCCRRCGTVVMRRWLRR
jgi:hypothetical protein